MNMSASRITKHFISVPTEHGSRQVHYRRAGGGPVVVMLHQSPSSSRDLIPLIEAFASDFTVIAPDTPGYGLSESFELTDPVIDDYAVALATFLDLLGVGDVCLLGNHTGAAIAIEFARRFPARTQAVVTNGYVLFTDAERDDVLQHYFVPFEPESDGAHFTRVWTRIRDQVIFFPWYAQFNETRLAFDVPDAKDLMPTVNDLLRAGLDEPIAYRAAFLYPGFARLQDLTVPTGLFAAHPDPLADQLERLGEIPDCIEAKAYESYADLFARAREIFHAHASGAAPEPVIPVADGHFAQDYIHVAQGQVYVRRCAGLSDEPPLLLLHHVGESAQSFRALADVLAGHRTLLAIDLPGHGETGGGETGDGVAIDPSHLTDLAILLQDILTAEGIDCVDVLADGLAASVATSLAQTAPQRVRRLIFKNIWYVGAALKADLATRAVPDVTPRFHGGHLLAAWFFARDSELFWPWYDTRAEAALPLKGLDPRLIHQRACDLLKAWDDYPACFEAALSYDLRPVLPKLTQPVLFAADPDRPHYRYSEDAVNQTRQGCVKAWPDDVRAQADVILAFLDKSPEKLKVRNRK